MMERKTRVILAFFLAACCFTSVSLAKKGVVFIHGRGVAKLADPAQAQAYWGDLAKTATRYESIPTKIVHYRGVDKLTDAAPVVADQIASFMEQHKIGANELKIYAHSYGGIVIRYIFSNASNLNNYQKIIDATKDVTTISSPHLGSEAADLAYEWDKKGSLPKKAIINSDEHLSYNASAQELRTSQMAEYNQNCILWGYGDCPDLPKPFFLITAGNINLRNDFIAEGHIQDLGLLTIAKLVTFQGKHDGLVSQASAEGLTNNAVLWFNTERNHYHQRNDEYTPEGEKSFGLIFEKDIFM